MALQQIGGLMMWPGQGQGATNAFGSTTLDAAGKYHAWAILAQEDMTISHVGLKLNAVSGSPTADIRIEEIDPATGLPTGTLWATNTNIVTGTLTTTWTVHPLTATANVSRGQWVSVKVQYNSGTSLQLLQAGNSAPDLTLLNYQIVNTGTPAKSTGNMAAMALGSSSTSMYYLGSHMWPLTGSFSASVNNSNGGRIGARFQVPFACEILGLALGGLINQDFDATIFDDAGSAISGVTGSYDASLNNTSRAAVIFGTPHVPTINTWYRAAVVPTTANNVAVAGWTCQDTNMLSGMVGRGQFRRTDYTTAGGWSDTNAAAVPRMDLLIRRLADGVGGSQSFSAYVM